MTVKQSVSPFFVQQKPSLQRTLNGAVEAPIFMSHAPLGVVNRNIDGAGVIDGSVDGCEDG